MKDLILGDSHVGPMLRAAEHYKAELSPAIEAKKLRPVSASVLGAFVVTDETGIKLLNPLLLAAIAQAGHYDPFTRQFNKGQLERVVLCFGGSHSHMVGFKVYFASKQVFFHDQQQGFAVHEGDAILPRNALKTYFDNSLSGILEGVSMLESALAVRIELLMPPPPHKDNAYIMGKHPKLQNLPLPYTRLGIFQCLTESIEQLACQRELLLHPNPPGVSDPEGFLSEPYWGDGIHANDCYGRDVLKCLFG